MTFTFSKITNGVTNVTSLGPFVNVSRKKQKQKKIHTEVRIKNAMRVRSNTRSPRGRDDCTKLSNDK